MEANEVNECLLDLAFFFSSISVALGWLFLIQRGENPYNLPCSIEQYTKIHKQRNIIIGKYNKAENGIIRVERKWIMKNYNNGNLYECP